MRKTLLELWEENFQDMSGVIEIGDEVLFNDKYFSDSYMFLPNNKYKVSDVEPLGIEVEVPNEQKIFIHPDGLSSFEIVENVYNT